MQRGALLVTDGSLDEEPAVEIRARAEHDAAVLLAAAEADAGVVYDWVRHVRASAEADAAEVLEEARTAAETVLAEARLEATNLIGGLPAGHHEIAEQSSILLHDAETKARRMVADAEAARSDVDQEVAELRGRAWSELEALQAEILEEALEEAERILADAAAVPGRQDNASWMARQIVNRAYKTSTG